MGKCKLVCDLAVPSNCWIECPEPPPEPSEQKPEKEPPPVKPGKCWPNCKPIPPCFPDCDPGNEKSSFHLGPSKNYKLVKWEENFHSHYPLKKSPHSKQPVVETKCYTVCREDDYCGTPRPCYTICYDCYYIDGDLKCFERQESTEDPPFKL